MALGLYPARVLHTLMKLEDEGLTRITSGDIRFRAEKDLKQKIHHSNITVTLNRLIEEKLVRKEPDPLHRSFWETTAKARRVKPRHYPTTPGT